VRVLVVEDVQPLAEAIADGLRGQAMAVDVVFDGGAATERLAVNSYDVVVLDRDLPVIHGDDVCRSLTGSGAAVRILMLTAAGDLSDRVAGLNLGADDYLAKPFAFTELIAPGSGWIRPATRHPGTGARCHFGTRSSSSWRNSCAAAALSCPPSNSWRRPGMRTSTRSRTSSGSRS
jgi:DNA-binding response OmpR family regulator